MFRICLADTVFEIDNKYEYMHNLCKDYVTELAAEYTVSVTEKEISSEDTEKEGRSRDYLESLALYRKICTILIEKDIVLFHCSSLSVDGKAYLFTAPSGTGKSTHAALWRKVLGEKVTMINDDKPLLKIKDSITVFGTPFGGKYGIQSNTSGKVAGIVVLKQSKQNKISPLPIKEAFPLLLNQTYRIKSPEAMNKILSLVEKLCSLPVYLLECDISYEAVKLSYQTITGKSL